MTMLAKLGEFMEFDTIYTYALALVPLMLGLFHWMKLYFGFRSERFRLSSKKSKRFNQLMKKKRWRTASPMELQSAFAEAFSYELDDRHIRFALERHRPLQMFRELRRCVGMIRLTEDGKGFEHWNGLKFKNCSYRRQSQWAFAMGFIPYVGFMVFGTYLTDLMSKPHLAITGIAVLVWTGLTITMAGWFESAHRLVEALDDLFPVWTSDEPQHAEREVGARIAEQATTSRGKRTRKSDKESMTSS